MSWHDQVVEEEWQGGMVSEEEPRFGSGLNPDAPPPGSEGGATSDVSMADDGLTQHDLDVVVEEEWEEDMETGMPPSPRVPTPPEESPMLQGSKAGDTPGIVKALRTALMIILPGIWTLMKMSCWGQQCTSLSLGDIWMTQ